MKIRVMEYSRKKQLDNLQQYIYHSISGKTETTPLAVFAMCKNGLSFVPLTTDPEKIKEIKKLWFKLTEQMATKEPDEIR